MRQGCAGALTMGPMGAIWGWALAVAALAVGWAQWGWPGAVMGVTLVVFWLLLQFNRALRVMRQAAGAPVGRVASAVMLHARLRTGMRLLDVIPLTRSLGQPAAPEADPDAGPSAGFGVREAFVWSDESGACVRVELRGGRVVRWALQRPADPTPTAAVAPPGPAQPAE
jgi:hypothetical protein